MGVFDRLLTRMRTHKLLGAGESFAKFPSNAPSSFSAAAFDNWATAVGQATNKPYPVSAQVKTPWRWTGSLGEFAGVERGGLHDVVKANAYALNDVKGDVDVLGQAVLELRADVQALQEAPPARPFP